MTATPDDIVFRYVILAMALLGGSFIGYAVALRRDDSVIPPVAPQTAADRPYSDRPVAYGLTQRQLSDVREFLAAANRTWDSDEEARRILSGYFGVSK